MVDPKYQEILKLHTMLLDEDIPHDIERDLDDIDISKRFKTWLNSKWDISFVIFLSFAVSFFINAIVISMIGEISIEDIFTLFLIARSKIEIL